MRQFMGYQWSRWPTWLGRRHLLVRLSLHGFEPCQRYNENGRWDDPLHRMIQQDVSGRPAHDS